MDIEQLKMILETLSAAGEGAFALSVLWLLQGYFSTLISFGMVIIVVSGCIRFTKMIIRHLSFSGRTQRMISYRFNNENPEHEARWLLWLKRANEREKFDPTEDAK